MDEALYKIVFDGLIVPEIPAETVKTNLARLFKCDLSRIEPLFSGKLSTLKRGLSEEKARHYVETLRKAGAIALMESEVPARVLQPESQETSSLPPPVQTHAAAEEAHYCKPKIFSLKGRIGRFRWLSWSVGAIVLPYFATFFFFSKLSIHVLSAAFIYFMSLVFFALFSIITVFPIVFSFRRLHDIGLSGKWSLLCFLPMIKFVPILNTMKMTNTIVGSTMGIFALFLLLKSGTKGSNDYGLPPPPNSWWLIALMSCSLLLSLVWLVSFIAALLATNV